MWTKSKSRMLWSSMVWGMFLLVLASGVWAADANWPMGRGDLARTGKAAGELPEKPQRLWRFKMKGAVEAEAAISTGTVYVGSARGQFCALDLATGQPRWRQEFDTGFDAAPCVVKDRVFLMDTAGTLRCLNALNGQTLWTTETASENHSSPAWVEGKLLVGSYNQNLFCLDAENGKTLWKFTTGGPVHCAPMIAGGRAHVAGCDSTLHAIEIATGKEAWAVEMASYSAANAAAFGEGVYVGHYGGAVLASDLKDGHALWTFTPPQNDQVPFHAACAVPDDLVVAASRDKNVYGLERASGKLLWQFPTKGEIDAAPVIVGTRVFVASRDGNLYGLDLKSGAKFWVYESGSSFKAAPAVVAPKLVVGDVDGFVYCFGPAEAAAPGQAGAGKTEGALKQP